MEHKKTSQTAMLLQRNKKTHYTFPSFHSVNRTQKTIHNNNFSACIAFRLVFIAALCICDIWIFIPFSIKEQHLNSGDNDNDVDIFNRKFVLCWDMWSFVVCLMIIITPYYFLFPFVVHNEEDNDMVITFLCVFQSAHVYLSFVQVKWNVNEDVIWLYERLCILFCQKTSIPLYEQFS